MVFNIFYVPVTMTRLIKTSYFIYIRSVRTRDSIFHFPYKITYFTIMVTMIWLVVNNLHPHLPHLLHRRLENSAPQSSPIHHFSLSTQKVLLTLKYPFHILNFIPLISLSFHSKFPFSFFQLDLYQLMHLCSIQI
jgi:hypothetical protein